jgi:hypothetical protein
MKFDELDESLLRCLSDEVLKELKADLVDELERLRKIIDKILEERSQK